MPQSGKKNHRPFSRWLTFILLFSFWAVLSGFFDWFHLSLGIAGSAAVSFFSHDLLFPQRGLPSFRTIASPALNFLLYIPWLLVQVALANLHVIYLVWHPRMPIDPQIVRFKTKWREDFLLTVMANSITLTPGTATLDIRAGEFHVHALSRKVAAGLLGGKMQERVGRMFGQKDWQDHG
jgi:multicomponent Na+:H+ antiporter subunit E